MSDTRTLLESAVEARRQGRPEEAVNLLRRVLANEPRSAAAWNSLGILHLEQGRPSDAAECLLRAVDADPAPALWLNLSHAYRGLGQHDAELRALEAALEREPYFLPAVLAKGEALRALDRAPEAVELYRLLLNGIGDARTLPAPVREKLDEAQRFVREQGDRDFEQFQAIAEDVATRFPDVDLKRATAYAEHKAGRRKVYQQQPTGAHFPFLPAIEFFDRELFPWFDELEKDSAQIRDELLSLWADDDPNFRPYVAYPPGTPTNQWTELNHSPRWSAWFFWENGERNAANCARCPRTAALLDRLPLLDLPGKGPTAMFSVLKPRTTIPAHTGTSNVRTTVHLPLVVPAGCRFRVGAESREWREGEAWAFDDTIEHEAWNDSDSPRAILIVDCWNPLLTEAEKDIVRAIG